MLKINAIPTIYNNIKFRSRLEARYAVFFDNTNVEYLYEPEGYILPNGKCYLPDFYLPQLDIFIEIKPTKPTQEEIDKAIELVNMTETGLIFFWGVPDFCTDGMFVSGNLSCFKKNKKLFGLSEIANKMFCGILNEYETEDNDFAFEAFLRYLKTSKVKPKTSNVGFKNDIISLRFISILINFNTCNYGFIYDYDPKKHRLIIRKASEKANSFNFQK